MARLFLGIVLLAVAPPAAAAAGETWIELRSPHFIIYTDGSSKRVRGMLNQLERFRSVFRVVFPGEHIDALVPLRVIVVRNSDDFRLLLPEYWESGNTVHPSGYFVGDSDGGYVVLSLETLNTPQESSYLVLAHEYIHLLESLNFPHLPLWISEGFADYYGNVRITGKDTADLGYPIGRDVELFQNSGKIKLTQLMSMDESSPGYNETGKAPIFYAEAWAFTDFLFTADHSARLPLLMRFLSLVSHGVPSMDAARQAFGDIEHLDDLFNRFMLRGAFPHYQVRMPELPQDAEIPVRQLSDAEIGTVRANFMFIRNRPEDAHSFADSAIRLDPTLASPYVTLGMLALRSGDQASALAMFQRAADLHSTDYLDWYYRAMLSLKDHRTPEIEHRAEADLEEAIRLCPDFAEGYRALADLKSLLRQDTAHALQLARHAVSLRPNDAENVLTVGVVLLRMHQIAEAASEGRRALGLAHTFADRENVSNFLNAVNGARASVAAGQAASVYEWPTTMLPGRPPSAPFGLPSDAAGTADNPDLPSASGLSATDVSGAPAAAPTAPGVAHGASARVPVASSAREARVVEGVASQVVCSGNELSFLLAAPDGQRHLHSADFTRIEFESSVPVQANFSPCTGLDGRKLRVEYNAAADPRSGDVVHVKIEK